MPDLHDEKIVLELLDQRITAAEGQATSLDFEIRKRRSARMNTAEAEQALQEVMEALEEWRMRRYMILGSVAQYQN